MLKIIAIIIIYVITNKAICNDDVSTGVEIISVEITHPDVKATDKLSDTISHTPGELISNSYPRSTRAHETVHLINSYLRGKLFESGKRNFNAFYCGESQAIILKNPDIKIRHVLNFIPASLRGGRYNLYFLEQIKYWDDVPTYIMDEWSAYIRGAEVGVEDFYNNLPKEKSDIVCGALEFSIYSVALCVATKNCDPVYWKKDLRLKHSVKYFLIKSEKVFFKGCDLFPSEKQKKLLHSLRFGEDAIEIRQFIFEEFDGIFLK